MIMKYSYNPKVQYVWVAPLAHNSVLIKSLRIWIGMNSLKFRQLSLRMISTIMQEKLS